MKGRGAAAGAAAGMRSPSASTHTPAGELPVYTCTVHHDGMSLAPVSYTLELRFEYNQTALAEPEQAVARQLFERLVGRQARAVVCCRVHAWVCRGKSAGGGRCQYVCRCCRDLQVLRRHERMPSVEACQ